MDIARSIIALSLAAGALAAHAGEVGVSRAWARPTAQGQNNGGAYLSLDNRGSAADRLLAASAAVAESVELHTMSMDGDVMRMRKLSAIELPAGKAVELKPGGLHIMLMGLKAPLVAGTSFPLTLRFEKAGEVKVDVKVQSGMPAGHDMKH